MDKQIVINADDFGLCEGVNKAVEKAHTNGVLTSATIITNMPAAENAVQIAKKLPDLGIGVHLNLFKGKPISKEPSVRCLLDSRGQFAYSPPKLAILSILVHSIRNAIRTELAAQIRWVIDNGLKPTHLDSHKHIHCFPAIFPTVCDLARRFGIGAVRFAYEPKQLSALPWPLPVEGGKKKAQLIRLQASINRKQNSQFLKTDGLFGIAHLGKIDVNFLKAVTLYSSAAVAEVMTHPGLPDVEPAKTGLTQQHRIEFEALCSERTKQYFKDAKIKRVHYGQL